jgi:geranylgeranyl diphosphate synthase type II
MQAAEQLKSAVESHLTSLALAQRQPANLYEPMAYILGLKGKRIRPVLVLLAYQAVSRRAPQEALNLAASVEMFHNFTLMHDDIMDRAPVRRGQPSVHVKWDENIAILSGDALFALSMGMVVQDFPALAAPLAMEYTRVAMGVCEGQQEDLDLATLPQVDIAQYLEMIRKKTAVLLGGCLSLGAMAGGADASVVDDMRQYGEYLGIAFQLQDDLMDAFPPENFGKQVGGDIIENKKTYLYLRACELADAAQQRRLTYLFSHEVPDEEKVAEVLDIFRQTNIPQETRELIDHYFNLATQLSQSLAQRVDFSGLQNYLSVIVNRKV